ncbi:bifunctional UDP-N-acetylglucosamine diphosphorylase/glucosamine-1-phosphate N-acetyltransferase GlmU [Acidicapsa acidisoli]|uniref:bifunctional UDP-N-acetylglucosamine diphosphorylase/glucosamine-1-phosphate N-acetyltransferase GlmU n=1 Tax=Acidicapsa acidisoli TaxID=1615681 RepID=UPI0021E0536D|nr:bifunctional UDP-N-acetylglucosamine diphosphorylase/glucosamine-1-phosphate N-acetyltransferase GlmU [Acidicapsa acidisoli]
MSLAVVIMAAGKGTRLKSRRPKVLHEIGGKPLLAHVIAAASKIVPAADIHVVVGHEAERVQTAVAGTNVNFVLQAEQLGTGHAIQCAREAIAGYNDVLVLSGDVPLIRPETLEMLLEYHRLGSAMTILTALPKDPFGYGRIVRRESENALEVEAIVEQKFLRSEQLRIPEINTGIYVFQTKPLISHLKWLISNDENGEYYLTDLARIFVREGELVTAVEAADADEVLGANTIPELVALDASLRAKTALRLMLQGVTIFRPETCVIDAEVEVGPDTVIEPYVQLLGRTKIGSDCMIRSSTVIENSVLADNVLIRQSCIIADSEIGGGAKIGPFAHLRPGSEIGEDVHIGNFVETKKAKLGKGAKASHLTYLGDAVVGAGSNIGAGVITCNYDGVNKHTTTIGEGVFVGSDSTLVAPILIGDGAYIGAGSCITREVPADALAVGRSRQVTKDGWAAARREQRGKQS